MVQAGRAEAVAPVPPGEGVLPAHADGEAGTILRVPGARLRHTDLAVMTALGIAEAALREPRVRVVRAGRPGEAMQACCALLAAAVEAGGGAALLDPPDGDSALQAALHHAAADAVIAVGGTGAGASDTAVGVLAASGELCFHGLGLSPGETTAFGFVGTRPVLLLPGRLDAVLAVWLMLGRRLLARLAGAAVDEQAVSLPLTRKVASTVGIASVVPVRRRGDAVEPLATGYLPLSVIGQADGWIFVKPDSEGYPAGAMVDVRPLP
jgi:molybdopterin biosynthesis enzyme